MLKNYNRLCLFAEKICTVKEEEEEEDLVFEHVKQGGLSSIIKP